ncbi:unnamed protein product [Lactuca saligna]|uniref:Uncharacterized protein n=1 Tax=Lactuca saligna TaxID=75948 RepID=A0AA35YR91_LACSI|nr:unnamed protein product [Lactuca saligna]
MKISSRSFLNPARAGASRDSPPLFLSNSHNHRLRNSRSIKGGASPAMFPTIGKKRGSSFENPEPSSPKVTCICMRNNQRWVHLPFTICEGLRAFGSEGGDGSGRDANGGERVVELIAGNDHDENEEIDEMGIMN